MKGCEIRRRTAPDGPDRSIGARGTVELDQKN
jgi:hypothetical protein